MSSGSPGEQNEAPTIARQSGDFFRQALLRVPFSAARDKDTRPGKMLNEVRLDSTYSRTEVPLSIFTDQPAADDAEYTDANKILRDLCGLLAFSRNPHSKIF